MEIRKKDYMKALSLFSGDALRPFFYLNRFMALVLMERGYIETIVDNGLYYKITVAGYKALKEYNDEQT